MTECLMDFPPAAVWCPACYAEQQQSRMVAELREANSLKRRELELRDQRSEEENYWLPTPKPTRYIPKPEPKSNVLNPVSPTTKGGMSIEPRRKSL